MKRVYVTGSRGMVGSRFLELASKKYKIFSPEIDELDITDRSSLDDFFEKQKPDVLVHLAAFTDVGAAEKERDKRNGVCWKVNVDGTRNLAEVSKKYGTRMIYISTDYVFPGSKENPGPYAEDYIPVENSENVTWYGYTKSEGEKSVREVFGKEFIVLRIIYPVRANFSGKLDYIRKPLSLFDQGKLYPMFTDQQISISFIDEVVATIERIIDGEKTGVFHASSRDLTTPHELISYVIEKARGKKNAVQKSSLEEFLKKVDNPVRYPMYGGLKVEKTEEELEIKFSTWKEIVDKLIRQLEC